MRPRAEANAIDHINMKAPRVSIKGFNALGQLMVSSVKLKIHEAKGKFKAKT
jgi:hypothetical protein